MNDGHGWARNALVVRMTRGENSEIELDSHGPWPDGIGGMSCFFEL